ncbi:rod shape-determining protein MreC [Vulcaniibacterium tengchongense]|uniref:Cell shape-determining protein MreC n=2 Tax=Vulcaniibacterium tengchongense TaxID=1273429 RepID=A0A3N4VAZ5_9GAMM|nr:rod shape-determining protein MreC [Vulcaniibacterium tengchongense]RPE79758.1 rod shape-determining protein MreC [Vulcaniibacterium tengchongense]
MPPYAGPPAAARADVAGTLRLLAYLALAVVLIVLDHRGGWLRQARQQATLAAQPLWMLAGVPGRLFERIGEDAGTLARLTEENRRLRRELLLNQARMARLQTVAADNERLRGLLDAAGRGQLDVMLAPILDIDLDPTRQRLVLDAGGRDRVRAGQSVIDAGGLLGQIIATTPMYANVLLITDPSHAVPVAVARTGVRLTVYGEGRSDRLRLASVPLSSDVKVGDLLVTSGMGGRFPPGFPVGRIARLQPDDSRAFLVGEVTPAAQLDRGREVLVLLSVPHAAPAAGAFGREAPADGTAPAATAHPPANPAAEASTGAPAAAPPAPAGAARPRAAAAAPAPSPPPNRPAEPRR